MSSCPLNGVGAAKSGNAPESDTVRERLVVCLRSFAWITNTKWSAVRGIIGSPQTKGYKPIAVVAPDFWRLRAGVIPRTRCIPEYAVEWPARAVSEEKLTSVVKPTPRGKGVGGRMPWRASTDFRTGYKRKLGLAPERAMPASGMAGQRWRKSAAEPAARIERFEPVGQGRSPGFLIVVKDRRLHCWRSSRRRLPRPELRPGLLGIDCGRGRKNILHTRRRDFSRHINPLRIRVFTTVDAKAIS
jgi:hypothetical protein